MATQRAGSVSAADRPQMGAAAGGHELDIERGSDVPISTQIYWQLAYQIESGRLQPGTRLPPVRELGAALRVNPNTVRAVYRRLADAGYVVGRHGAGTRVVDRPPVRRGSDALAGIVAETLRRYPSLREVVWAQEEPQNMGPWRSIRHRLEEAVRASSAESLRYVGRTWKASPSEGYPTAHQVEQDRIVRTALGVAS